MFTHRSSSFLLIVATVGGILCVSESLIAQAVQSQAAAPPPLQAGGVPAPPAVAPEAPRFEIPPRPANNVLDNAGLIPSEVQDRLGVVLLENYHKRMIDLFVVTMPHRPSEWQARCDAYGRAWSDGSIYCVIMYPAGGTKPLFHVGGERVGSFDQEEIANSIRTAHGRVKSAPRTHQMLEGTAIGLSEELSIMMNQMMLKQAFGSVEAADPRKISIEPPRKAALWKRPKVRRAVALAAGLVGLCVVVAAFMFWRRRGALTFPACDWRRRLGGDVSGGSGAYLDYSRRGSR